MWAAILAGAGTTLALLLGLVAWCYGWVVVVAFVVDSIGDADMRRMDARAGGGRTPFPPA